MGMTAMGKKQELALGIALQTQVLKVCPGHNQVYCDDETFTDDHYFCLLLRGRLVRRPHIGVRR